MGSKICEIHCFWHPGTLLIVITPSKLMLFLKKDNLYILDIKQLKCCHDCNKSLGSSDSIRKIYLFFKILLLFSWYLAHELSTYM